jgi:hypothetical protein
MAKQVKKKSPGLLSRNSQSLRFMSLSPKFGQSNKVHLSLSNQRGFKKYFEK